MQIYGVFSRFINRNEKTGYSRFTIKTVKGVLYCDAVCVYYPKFTPLYIEGTLKDNTIKADLVQACSYNIDVLEEFLVSDIFSGVGANTARKIVELFNKEDIFAKFRENPDFEEVIKPLKIKQTNIITALSKIHSISFKERFIQTMERRGISYSSAQKIFSIYKEGSENAINHNPYILLSANVPFQICENLSKELGKNGMERERIAEIVRHIIYLNRKNGNTKMTFSSIVKVFRSFEESAENIYNTSPLFIGEALVLGNYVLEEDEGDIFVYTDKDYAAELSIAKNIKRLMITANKLDDRITIPEIEALCEVDYSDEQKATFDIIKKVV